MAASLHVVLLLLAAAWVYPAHADGPKLDCPDEVEALLYEYDKIISCQVTSDPWVHSGYLTYYKNNKTDEENLVSLRLGEYGNGYFFSENKENKTVDLRIKTVYRQDFRNFTFVVENTQGMHEMEVVLIPEDPSQLVDSGAGQGAVLASGILILAAATHLLQLV